MELSDSVRERYTREPFSARQAQRLAEFIAWGPVAFQVSRLMIKFGVLDTLRDASEGLTASEVAKACDISDYAARCLLEASLSVGTVLADADSGRYSLSKTGWFLLNDPATRVNIDFVNDVCYEGLFRLEESLHEGRPAGLEHFGSWPTIYEGLSSLPADAQRSWFAFDHFYSDSSFDEALDVVFASNPRTLLDVGGNTGRWALQCVGRSSDVSVVIADLPQQIEMMRKAVSGKLGSERIAGYGVNMLDPQSSLPLSPSAAGMAEASASSFDVIWMSQFLDCFSDDEVVMILRKAASIMSADSRLYIMETLWGRQRFEPASLCLTMTSIYFTAMANGNSKMFRGDDLVALIEKAGMEVEEIHDNLGQGHSILKVRKKGYGGLEM